MYYFHWDFETESYISHSMKIVWPHKFARNGKRTPRLPGLPPSFMSEFSGTLVTNNGPKHFQNGMYHALTYPAVPVCWHKQDGLHRTDGPTAFGRWAINDSYVPRQDARWFALRGFLSVAEK